MRIIGLQELRNVNRIWIITALLVSKLAKIKVSLEVKASFSCTRLLNNLRLQLLLLCLINSRIILERWIKLTCLMKPHLSSLFTGWIYFVKRLIFFLYIWWGSCVIFLGHLRWHSASKFDSCLIPAVLWFNGWYTLVHLVRGSLSLFPNPFFPRQLIFNVIYHAILLLSIALIQWWDSTFLVFVCF